MRIQCGSLPCGRFSPLGRLQRASPTPLPFFLPSLKDFPGGACLSFTSQTAFWPLCPEANRNCMTYFPFLLPLPPSLPLFIHLFSFFQFFHACILNKCLPFAQLCPHNPHLHSHSSPTTPRTYETCTSSNQTTAQHGDGEVNAMSQEAGFKW